MYCIWGICFLKVDDVGFVLEEVGCENLSRLISHSGFLLIVISLPVLFIEN